MSADGETHGSVDGFPAQNNICLAANRFVRVKDIPNAISLNRCVALTGFHAYTGCDVTGKFHGKGKASWWKIFVDAEDDTIAAFIALGCDDLSKDNLRALEKFACKVFCGAGTRVDNLAEATHQASQILPNMEEFGWQRDNKTGKFIAKASSSPIAPKEILELVKCGCKGKCETSKCSCYSKRLSCTKMCHCTECENTDFCTEIQYQDEEEDETDD